MKRAPLMVLALALAATLGACERGSERSAGTAASGNASTSDRSATATLGAGAASASRNATAAPAAPVLPPTGGTVTTAANQNVSAGGQIAAQGAPGAAACVGCHGANGEGNAQGGFPRIAGLGRFYIEHQLNSYADGTRANPVMTPIAAALGPQQRAQAAAYYAGLGGNTAAGASGAASGSPADAQPPVLADRGDERRGIQACVNCHGPQGIGDAGANPYLAGQHESYLVAQIAQWKSGARHNDPSGQMPAIAKALSDDEARQLAAYFAGLPPPAPRNAQAAVALNTSRPPVQSGPSAATMPAQGQGAQQGSALTGGAQGQGSGGAATNPGQSPNR